MFDALVRFVREQYRTQEFIPLHAPVFKGQESGYVQETIESTFVSSVGAFVDRFENDAAAYTGAARAIATVNGTAALHVALLLAGVRQGDLVISQALTFVATCNAIAYCGAQPIFVDVDRRTLGMSPTALQAWLDQHARLDIDGSCRTKVGDQRIAACLPMHTFGHPADLDGLLAVCERWNLPLVEDAAESLGSFYRGRHTGSFGLLGTLSFNGNKIITTGGGGMILTNDELGGRAKHLTTTAKRPHPFEYVHDEIGFNYRLPNLNAALGCAQLEQLELFIASKRELAERYASHLAGSEFTFMLEPDHCRSNYWLNAVICPDRTERDGLLETCNAAGVMTRPIWQLMCDLPAYSDCLHDGLEQSRWLVERVVNLPSSVLPEHLQ
ncbi:LegC family aminotransferase [Pseudomonas sp. NPDC089554]|uniref:LegC family aminotransferase n=1 Tax=Pseudomonas sp. NPDC089554 TaxID=3390653 RepID=UPI003CFCDFBA